MQIKNRNIKCAYCGTSFVAEIMVSQYHKDMGLDQKPEFEYQLPQLIECPNCHYVSYDVELEPINKSFLNMESYHRDYIESMEKDSLKKYEAALYIVESDMQKLRLHLEYCWALEFVGRMDEAKRERISAVELLDNLIKKEPQVELVLMYIDCVRQLGEFDQAKAMIELVDDDMQQAGEAYAREVAIYTYLKKLVKEGDMAPHMISEVI